MGDVIYLVQCIPSNPFPAQFPKGHIEECKTYRIAQDLVRSAGLFCCLVYFSLFGGCMFSLFNLVGSGCEGDNDTKSHKKSLLSFNLCSHHSNTNLILFHLL